jgi:hypothetical protein
MTPLEASLLDAIAGDERDLAAASPPATRDPANIRLRLAKDDLEALGVRVDLPRWIPGAGESAQRAARRALLKLASAGLVRLSRARGAHITHAALSDKGRELLAE